MEPIKMPSSEEMEELLRKAQAELNAALEKMTPEERAQAEARAKKAVEEDEAARKALLDSAAAVMRTRTAKLPR